VRQSLHSILALAIVAVAAPRPAAAGFASPINGGCYLVAANDCRIHLDPFVVNINEGAGAALERVELYADGVLIYHWRPDVSNPPRSDYMPSIPAQDFRARCGQTYTVNMLAKDSSDADRLNYGQFQDITCPSTVP